MAYANQDFGDAAPPDAGGHVGCHTKPDHLVQTEGRTTADRPRPLRTRGRSRYRYLGDLAAGAILVAAAALMVAANWSAP